jgi:hypothetical protein
VFDRRRYMLLCVVVAELLLVPVTTIGLLADRVVQATVADDALARSWWLITQRGQTPKAASRERTLIADKPDRNRRPVTAAVTLRQLTTKIGQAPSPSSHRGNDPQPAPDDPHPCPESQKLPLPGVTTLGPAALL